MTIARLCSIVFAASALIAGCRGPNDTSGLRDDPTPASSRHAHYDLLKPFRTYVTVDRFVPLSPNFWVFYRADGFGSDREYAVVEGEAVGLPGGFQAGSMDLPSTLPGSEVPSALASEAEAVTAKLTASMGDSTISDVTIRYLGEFYNIEVQEHVPYGALATDDRVLQNSGTYNFRIDAALTTMTPTSSLGSGTSLLCSTFFPEDCEGEPKFVDFVMPAAFEGTAPIAATPFGEGRAHQAYTKIRETLDARIIRTVEALAAGRYVNPIARIIARQGSSTLPQKAQQEVALSLSAYVYPLGDEMTKMANVDVVLKTEDLAAGAVTRPVDFGDLGLTGSVTIDLPAHQVALTIRHIDGEEHALALGLTSDRVVIDGARTYIKSYETISGADPSDWMATSMRFEALTSASGALVSVDQSLSVLPYKLRTP